MKGIFWNFDSSHATEIRIVSQRFIIPSNYFQLFIHRDSACTSCSGMRKVEHCYYFCHSSTPCKSQPFPDPKSLSGLTFAKRKILHAKNPYSFSSSSFKRNSKLLPPKKDFAQTPNLTRRSSHPKFWLAPETCTPLFWSKRYFRLSSDCKESNDLFLLVSCIALRDLQNSDHLNWKMRSWIDLLKSSNKTPVSQAPMMSYKLIISNYLATSGSNGKWVMGTND